MFTKRIQELSDFLKTSSFLVLIQKCVIFVSLLFLAKPAWDAFRNLHIKYSRKKKLKAVRTIFPSHMVRTLCVWKRNDFKLWRGSRQAILNWSRVRKRWYWKWNHLCCWVREVPNFCCYKKKSLSQKRQQTSGKTCRRKVEVSKEIKINSITTS